MSKGVHNIAFYVSPDPECSRTTQNSEISLAPSRGRILYAIYGNSTCVINHIVVTTEVEKEKYRAEGRCFTCGRQGHISCFCLDKKPWAAAISISDDTKDKSE